MVKDVELLTNVVKSEEAGKLKGKVLKDAQAAADHLRFERTKFYNEMTPTRLSALAKAIQELDRLMSDKKWIEGREAEADAALRNLHSAYTDLNAHKELNEIVFSHVEAAGLHDLSHLAWRSALVSSLVIGAAFLGSFFLGKHREKVEKIKESQRKQELRRKLGLIPHGTRSKLDDKDSLFSDTLDKSWESSYKRPHSESRNKKKSSSSAFSDLPHLKETPARGNALTAAERRQRQSLSA